MASAASLASLSYWPTLSLGLFSEDLIHHYIALLSLRHLELIRQSFCEPWTQCSKLGLFWRPIIDISFLIDCLAGEQVWLYHLLSLVYHICSAVLLGLIAQRVAAASGLKRWRLTAVLAASLFAVNPLAAETLAWLSCRCDELSCLFSLLSFWLYLRADAKPSYPSLLAYITALLCKENAIMLPVVIVIHSAVLSGKARALSSAKSFLIVTFIYIGLRLQVLGALGGYEGAIGEILRGNLIDRLLHPMHWLRIFYPLNEAFGYLACIYSFLYGVLFVLILKAATTATPAPSKFTAYLLFFLAAAALMMVPAAGAFVVNEVLFGGRFLYLPVAFYSLFLAFLLISLGRNGLVWAALYLGLSALSANLNLTAWVSTSENLKSLSQALGKRHDELTLVNIPFNYTSVTSIYDDWQLKLLCKSTAQSLADVANLHIPQRLSYIQNLINYAQLKAQCLSGQVPVFFDVRDNRLYDLSSLVPLWFEPIDLTIPVTDIEPDSQGSQMINFHTVPEPQRADFIELTVKAADSPKQTCTFDAMVPAYEPQGSTVTISWCTNLTSLSANQAKVKAALPDLSRSTVYRVPLSDKVNWKCANTINAVSISGLPPGCKVSSIRLRDESKLVPRLTIKNESGNSAASIVSPNKSAILEFDSSKIGTSNTGSTCLEISGAENAFCMHPMTFRETCARKGSRLLFNLPCQGELTINRDMFKKAGHYYLRVQAMNDKKKPTEFFSDPIELTVVDRDFQSDFDHLRFDLRPERHR